MRETQKSVSEWAEATFGPATSNLRIAVRANEEMAELLQVLAVNDKDPKALNECADVVIVLYRLIERFGADLRDLIDDKMEVHRAREWEIDGSGHGYHVKKGV